ncbi:unannotated protein [freshwater metagenome]|uniref:Unannotated protein n=1 Tax=freshwater metagenome TaxID=449393 RepID=A0A6J7JAU5_9ZZZZ
MTLPHTCGGRRCNSDTALLLLLHPIHGCSAFVYFTDLVIDTGVEKDALSGCGFARVNVRHDSNVANRA